MTMFALLNGVPEIVPGWAPLGSFGLTLLLSGLVWCCTTELWAFTVEGTAVSFGPENCLALAKSESLVCRLASERAAGAVESERVRSAASRSRYDPCAFQQARCRRLLGSLSTCNSNLAPSNASPPHPLRTHRITTLADTRATYGHPTHTLATHRTPTDAAMVSRLAALLLSAIAVLQVQAQTVPTPTDLVGTWNSKANSTQTGPVRNPHRGFEQWRRANRTCQ